ncbi:MAG TPA: hypothetical protein V6D11_17805 [Waterburya sp.]
MASSIVRQRLTSRDLIGLFGRLEVDLQPVRRPNSCHILGYNPGNLLLLASRYILFIGLVFAYNSYYPSGCFISISLVIYG